MPTISVKVTLPQEVLDQFQEEGNLGNNISKHLMATKDFTSDKPIYITDVLRRRLDRLFGRNFQSATELVEAMERYVTARIGEVDIQLQPILLTRLKSRCFGKPFEQFLSERIVTGLEEFAGMR